MIKVQATAVKLWLKQPFHIAHGSSDYRENVFLRIEDGGKVAYGEAAVVPYYQVSKEAILQDLQQTITASMIRGRQSLEVLDRFKYRMSACAYSSAILSLQMQDATMSASGLLGCPNSKLVTKTSFTIAYDENLERMLSHIASCGFSTIKLKAGFADDLERIRIIRERFPNLAIRLDANQGWSYAQALDMMRQLKDLSIELIEEPMAGKPEQLSRLREVGGIPLLLDETVQNSEDLSRYADSVDGIVVKLAKSGGPQAAHALIEEASHRGLSVMLSCMVESSLALANALALAPLCRWIDLDAGLLLAKDVFSGLEYQNEVPLGSISSLVPEPALLEVFAQTPVTILDHDPLVVRDMQSVDIPACARIAAASKLAETYGFTEAGWVEKLSGALDEGVSLLFVAEQETEIVGFAWVHPRGTFLSAPYLRFIAVDDHAQGKGVGKRLLGEFETRTAALGKDLFLLVSDFNVPARKLYETQGYRIVGELKDFAIPGITEIVMVKKRAGTAT
ncbi:MAG: GNAT family N-acetyltransferase [Sphaerochaeta sp.]|uniref:GNAT family N-acetyltransferase n=1 Tax=Sphaerochaeta sp. TaxID=1972642 RepID=UPI003D0F20AA